MRVLVTGGQGFIGKHVVEALKQSGHEPLTFDRKGEPGFLGDIRDARAVNQAIALSDGFIHLAAILGTQETVSDPRDAIDTNINGSINVLEAASDYRVPGVYIGVGNHWMQNPYSISKTTVERFIAMYNAERGTEIGIVRAMNAYGPGQPASRPYGPSRVRKITPAFICRALANEPIEVYGDGLQVSDMVYVSDVAQALVKSLEKGHTGTVEVGPLEHSTVLDVANAVIELTGSTGGIKHLPMRPGEVPGAKVSANTETLKEIGMDARDFVPLREGLARTVEHFRWR